MRVSFRVDDKSGSSFSSIVSMEHLSNTNSPLAMSGTTCPNSLLLGLQVGVLVGLMHPLGLVNTGRLFSIQITFFSDLPQVPFVSRRFIPVFIPTSDDSSFYALIVSAASIVHADA